MALPPAPAPVAFSPAPADVSGVLAGRIGAFLVDFVVIGRGAILHHDFPKKVAANAAFQPIALPVPEDHLKAEGLGTAFLSYMKTWKGFVAEPA